MKLVCQICMSLSLYALFCPFSLFMVCLPIQMSDYNMLFCFCSLYCSLMVKERMNSNELNLGWMNLVHDHE